MNIKNPPIVASVVQAGSLLLDTPRTLEKLADLAATARAAGRNWPFFPKRLSAAIQRECSSAPAWAFAPPQDAKNSARYFDSAIDVPGAETDFLGRVARDNQLYLVTGVIERSGGTLYCTVLFFSPAGELLGKHRKLMPTALERVVWGAGDGSTLTVLDTAIGKIGAVICWENYMPLLRTAMYAKGIQLYCAPTVDDRDVWTASMRHIACEGRCFVLSACQYLAGSSPRSKQPLIRGGSGIVTPLGDWLAGPAYGSEQILTAEIDLAKIAEGKFDLDVVGHYARADVFQLQVNESPQRVVSQLPPLEE